MNQKKLIISIIILLTAGILFLFSVSANQQSTGWIIYFENPKNDSLDFIIKNDGNTRTFSYSIEVDNNEIESGEIEARERSLKTVKINAENIVGKISISVSDGKRTAAIYKNLQD